MSNAKFFAAVRKICGGLDQTQVDSINGILSEAMNRGVSDPAMLGYMLSTGWGECRLRPVREGFKKSEKSARAYVARHYGHKYGKPAGPYKHWYYGRGLVQLTWLDNYKAVSKVLGIDLVKNPDLALQPDTAAKILVHGMLSGMFNGKGKGLAHYLGNGRRDWKNARRTVNITDKWQRFRDTAKRFAAALEAHGYEPGKPSTAKPKVKPTSGEVATGGAGAAVAGVGVALATAWDNGLWVLLSAVGVAAVAFIIWRVVKRK